MHQDVQKMGSYVTKSTVHMIGNLSQKLGGEKLVGGVICKHGMCINVTMRGLHLSRLRVGHIKKRKLSTFIHDVGISRSSEVSRGA